jgi:UDP-2,3-diacylglucosamine pyrophosphatase LpxH
MTFNKDAVWTRLSQIWDDQGVKTLETKSKRYAVISDTHFGDGGSADDFHHNQRALINALHWYLEREYFLILLGDIEEFWQFDLRDILKRYGESVYPAFRAFGDQRVIRVFGNHDYEWGGLVDPVKNHPVSTKAAEEALKLKDIHGQTHILLVHGHQGSLESDKFIWLSRFFVRLYRGIEPFLRPLGLFATGSVTKSQVTKDYERVMYTWGKRHKVMLICGHSHRAIFASKSHAEKLQEEIADLKAYNMRRGIHQTTRKKNLQKIEQLERQWDDERDKGRIIEQVDPGNVPLPCYFNSGCGLYTDGITAIEIDDDEIRLVKWSNSKLFAQPRVVFNQGKISEFIEQIMR